MNKLIIDCSEGLSVYVEKNGELFSCVDYDQKKHTDNLLAKLDELLCDAKIKISDIDVFGVCVGPGSFTGIRVAVSIVKGLAINNKSKICTASNFDIIYSGANENAYYILDGFSNNVYVRKYLDGKTFDGCEDIEEIIKEIKQNKNNIKIYAQNSKVQNMLKNAEIDVILAQNNTISCFNEKINKCEFTNINEINPIYLRASQAEIERLKKMEKTNESN